MVHCIYQLRNLVGRSNVKRDPKKDFNSCEDFFFLLVKGLIPSAAMEILDMTSFDDSPDEHIVPVNIWLSSKTHREHEVFSVCNQIVQESVNLSFTSDTGLSKEDGVREYAVQLLSIGLFYLEYRDGIKEGDGERVLRCWKFLLPLFFNSRRTNYSKEAILFFYQHQYLFTPRQAKQLLCSRFINTQGLKGKNIECDLHMEHLNRLCKDAIRDLGPNKTVKSIMRAAKALGTIDPVISNFDAENHIDEQSGSHKKDKGLADMKKLCNDLSNYKVFSLQHGRLPHPSFLKPPHLLHSRSKEILLVYIEQHIPG